MTEFNKKFINSLILKELIETKYNERNVVVKKYQLDDIEDVQSANGEYRSLLKKLNINYVKQQEKDLKQITIIVKIQPKITDHVEIFNKEASMYKNIIPRYETKLKKCGLNISFAPKLISSMELPDHILLLEDLSSDGNCVDAQQGLNYDQSKKAIKKLAIFHAISVVDMELNPDDYKQFHSGTLSPDNKKSQQFLAEALNTFIQNAEDIKIPGSVINKLKTLLPRLMVKGIEDYQSTVNGFTVLNHGDFWTKNIIFKQNKENQIADAVFIDYKNPFIGSPIIDLMYFLSSSVSYKILSSIKNELLYHYHTKLRDTFNSLAYKGYVPTLVDLHVEFLKRGFLELIFTLTTAPYLRTSIDSSFYPGPFNSAATFDAIKSKSVLSAHAENIMDELTIVENNGLLDWGTSESKIKLLINGFEK